MATDCPASDSMCTLRVTLLRRGSNPEIPMSCQLNSRKGSARFPSRAQCEEEESLSLQRQCTDTGDAFIARFWNHSDFLKGSIWGLNTIAWKHLKPVMIAGTAAKLAQPIVWKMSNFAQLRIVNADKVANEAKNRKV
jgi:hypothetical protein